MSKQDSNGVRTPQDLERKYDFASILGLKKNVETSEKVLVRIQNELNNFVKSTLTNIENLETQIDGKMTTWYYEGEPTLNNIPASTWNIEEFSEHEGDLYYDKSTGYGYIFQLNNGVYNWSKIENKDIIESLALANAAQDTADSKRQVFVKQPQVPYDVGDLWINNNEIYICQSSKSEGSFDINNWINNLKYTDDTYAKSVESQLSSFTNTITNTIDDIKNDLDNKIETWYYQGVPTLNNQPANGWDNDEYKSHVGDLYYDKLTGKVYRFESNYNWSEIENQDLKATMSLAETTSDTLDSKRQIFLSIPTTPYDPGDLWINNNEIYICTKSKTKNENYDSEDFTNNLKYTDDSYGKAIVEELQGKSTTVLNGTVTTQTKEWVKFTDLSTGGNTTIAGENIKTGNIQSNNYVENTTGMKISLNNGKIDTKNFKLDEEGNVHLNNNAKIISDAGLMTNLQYQGTVISQEFVITGDLSKCGFSSGKIINWNTWAVEYIKDKIIFDFKLPDNFVIVSAKMRLRHCPLKWTFENGSYTGYSRNVKLYKADYSGMYKDLNLNNVSVYSEGGVNYSEVSGAFGINGFNPGSSNGLKEVESIDLTDYIDKNKVNHFAVMTSDSISTATGIYNQSGAMAGTLEIIGYMPFE